jgi:hypothetical protein
MFYELRRYQIQPGKRDEFASYMARVVIPFQTSRGMVIPAAFLDEENADIYVWMRRFESEEQRESLYAAVYQSERWETEIAPFVKPFLVPDGITVSRLIPTPDSGLR